MSNYNNPDYPVSGVGSFVQHTYAPANNNASIEAMYFNSGMGMMQQQFDSRRNMGLNPNGFAPTNPFGPNQNTNTMMCGGYPTPSVPQQEQVMPFSNYPSNVPQQQQQQPTFNSLVDSRRTATAVNNTIGLNPWANQQQPQPQPLSPFTNQYGYTGQPTQYMYDTNILNGNGFGRRDGCWDNLYSQPNVINQPVVDWNNNQQQQQQQYGYGSGMPMPQYPAMNMSWREQAERNWGVR